jgi:hypothetical protein
VRVLAVAVVAGPTAATLPRPFRRSGGIVPRSGSSCEEEEVPKSRSGQIVWTAE